MPCDAICLTAVSLWNRFDTFGNHLYLGMAWLGRILLLACYLLHLVFTLFAFSTFIKVGCLLLCCIECLIQYGILPIYEWSSSFVITEHWFY